MLQKYRHTTTPTNNQKFERLLKFLEERQTLHFKIITKALNFIEGDYCSQGAGCNNSNHFIILRSNTELFCSLKDFLDFEHILDFKLFRSTFL